MFWSEIFYHRSRQYQAAAPGTGENNENSGSSDGPKQAEIPEWERARQALAKVSSQNLTKSPAKSSPNNNTNSNNAATANQQQMLAYQQYYQQYYQHWNGYAPYQYPYQGYVPAYTMPAHQPSVPPPPVSTCSTATLNSWLLIKGTRILCCYW